MATSAQSIEPTATEPDRTLRKLIGDNTKLDEVFTKERIAAAQKTLDDARSVFFDRARSDLTKLEGLAGTNAPPNTYETVFEEMTIYAGNLRGHAEMFGFRLVAEICNHIHTCCAPSSTHTPEVRIHLAGDLVRMLGIAIREKITDESGAVGRELRASLRKY